MKTWDVMHKRTTFNGQERWIRLGKAFAVDKGRISLVLEALPTGEFTGDLMLFPGDRYAPKSEPPPLVEPHDYDDGEEAGESEELIEKARRGRGR